MDKRTIFFMIALSLSFLGVNYYFEKQNQKKRSEWLVQQQGKRINQIAEISQEIQEKTSTIEKLPIVKAYSAEAAPFFYGISIDKDFITLKKQTPLPETIFLEQQGEKISYHLVYQPQEMNRPALYSQQDKAKLLIASLPDFGHYNLQIVTFDSTLPKIYLGVFTNGHLSLPYEELQNLQLLNEGREGNIQRVPNGIALLKTTSGFLPVGFYSAKEKNLIDFNEMEEFHLLVQQAQNKVAVTAKQKPEEKFFVLENAYQQIVFSNYGGAISEINLPFKSRKDEESVVREIEFDREMVKNHPTNAYFPAHRYFTAPETGSDHPIEHQKGTLGNYYPLLRRDLIPGNNRSSTRISPQYYALNFVSEYPEISELVYEVKKFTPNTIVFEGIQSHRKITKTYTISDETKGGPYCIDLQIDIEGDSRGLWLTSGVPEVEWISGAPAPALKYRITRNQKAEVDLIDLPKDVTTISSVSPDWICNSNGFLGTIMDPLSKTEAGLRAQRISGITVPSRLTLLGEEYNKFKAADLPGYMTLLPVNTASGTQTFRFFAGPFDEQILKIIDTTYSDPSTGYNPDYIACQTFHGWFSFISEPFAKFLFVLMNFFHSVTGSWALSIVLLTIFLRILLYPLNAWSSKSMMKMQMIAPDIKAIQEKYKKDPTKAQLEIMNLYREKGVNPFSGCLPLLIQMPFLIGMFDLLKSSFALRGAPFIPGWIDDLTAPDVLFSWNTPIFFIGNEFHLLPILLGAVMFIQQRYFSNAPTNVNEMTEQQRQQRAMGNMMTVVFTLMFYNFPSGLNIYWLSSMLLGMLQQWRMSKKMQGKLKEKESVVAKVRK